MTKPPKKSVTKGTKAMPQTKRDRKMVEVQEEFRELIEEVRKRRALKTDTAVVNQAIRELLERENLWPPKPDAKG